MRRALRSKLPALTRYTFGAINPLTVDDYTYAELNAYVTAMQEHRARGGPE